MIVFFQIFFTNQILPLEEMTLKTDCVPLYKIIVPLLFPQCPTAMAPADLHSPLNYVL